MAFGSYDESEQEQPGDNQEKDGQTVTNEIKGSESYANGESTLEDNTKEELMQHL